MGRYVVLLAGVASMALVARTMVAVAHDRGAPAPVHSVAAIDRQLRTGIPRRLRQPVWVRGIAEWCVAYVGAGRAGADQCKDTQQVLVDATEGAAPALPLIREPAQDLPTWLSRLPVLSPWLSRSQTPRWNQVAVYRVHLVQIPFDAGLCLRRPCYGARF